MCCVGGCRSTARVSGGVNVGTAGTHVGTAAACAQLVIADYLPKISYQTLLDRYVVASTLFLFLVVAQNAWVATAQQVRRGSRTRARLLGTTCLADLAHAFTRPLLSRCCGGRRWMPTVSG